VAVGVVRVCESALASSAMNRKGADKGRPQYEPPAWTSSSRHMSTLPVHRERAPPFCGKGIDYHGSAAADPAHVPHLAGMLDTPNAWLVHGEMMLVKWPIDCTIAKGFPPQGAPDSFMELKDELAVVGASVTIRGERKRKSNDGVPTYQLLKIVGPAGSVVQIYRRLRTVVGFCRKSFKGLPQANRPRVFPVNEEGHDNDGQGLENRPQSSTDKDNNEPQPDEVLSDDEYADMLSKGEDFRKSHELALEVGPVDVAQNNAEERTGQKSSEHDGVVFRTDVMLSPMDELLVYLLGKARTYLGYAPLCCNNNPTRSWMLEQLDMAEQRTAAQLTLASLPSDMMTVCVTTNMGRTQQCIAALLFNMVTSFVYCRHIKFVLVTFGNDTADVNLLRTIFAPVLMYGLLTIASGGQAGVFMSLEKNCHDMPYWMPSSPYGGAELESGQQMMPWLEYWHSSFCKNAAHMVADFKLAGQAKLYINADCDNFWPTAYLENIWAIYSVNQNTRGLCIIPGGDVDGGTTGRMVYRPVDFWAVGGYDENLSPAGGQDVDLRIRLGFYAVAEGTGKKLVKVKGPNLVGGCFPNDFANTNVKHDRGKAKTANIDPAVLRLLPGNEDKKWIQMNQKNWDLNMGPRLAKKEWRCNIKMVRDKTQFGTWWNCMPMAQIVPPDPIEGIPMSTWPYTGDRVPLSSGVADITAPQVAPHEAEPGGATSASSAVTPGDHLGRFEGLADREKRMVVNIFVVGIARLTEFDRDEHTCLVIHGWECLARATIAGHNIMLMIA
jgi:hypothetical protein